MPWQIVPAGEGVSSFDATVLPRPLQTGDNMVEILKFSRETAFTPETIQILAAALDEAWERLKKSGSRLARPAYSRVMREVVAKRIMEMAQRGVQDHKTLVEDALRFVTANYEEPSKLTKLTRLLSRRGHRGTFICCPLRGPPSHICLCDGKETGTKRAGSFHKASVAPRNRGVDNVDPWSSTKSTFSE